VDQSDYYAILGLTRDATPEEIRRAYHHAARRLHPDVSEQSDATDLFLLTQQAYETLADTKLREAYDHTLPPEQITNPILTKTMFSRSSLPRLDEPQLIYVLLDIKAPDEEIIRIARPPLNICLIIDRSTSMQGERMDVVKDTAIELVRKLREDDIFSLVTFSDRAEILVPAGRRLKRTEIETLIQMIDSSGATEIAKGLEAGFFETQVNLSKRFVNHVVLVTDGRTYGDEQECMSVAARAAENGVGISCLGIGEEWNDSFLDKIASKTGGSCVFIDKAEDIKRFLRDKFRTLGMSYAENAAYEFVTTQGVELNYAFRLAPEAGPLVNQSPLPLGSIPMEGALSVALEFKVPPLTGAQSSITLANGRISLEIPHLSRPTATTPLRLSSKVVEIPDRRPTPTAVVKALSRLTLYRMQERAQKALDDGNSQTAAKQLNNLATHLFSQGEEHLARTVLREAENLRKGNRMSESGKKHIKFGTRALMLPATIEGMAPPGN
jgi:Ca-activated chloride channel family protein